MDPFLTMISKETAIQIITPSATPKNKVDIKAIMNMHKSVGCAFAKNMTSWNSIALTTEKITVEEIMTIGI